MPDSSPISRLRRAAAVLRASGDADAECVAAGLERYFAEASCGLGLDQALGIRPAPGQRAWWTVEKIEQRDETLREIAETFLAGKKATEQARELARRAARKGGRFPARRTLRRILSGHELPPIRGHATGAQCAVTEPEAAHVRAEEPHIREGEGR